MEVSTLQRLRAERGLGLRELARLAKISHTTLVALESGQRKAQIATLGRLARVLKVPLDSLLEEYLDTSAPERGKLGWQAQAGQDKKQRKQR
jgi:transcriptional regulator with XRE-family HTH domain